MIKARNEPRNIVQVLEVIAAVKGIENPQELAETIYENSAKVFFPWIVINYENKFSIYLYFEYVFMDFQDQSIKFQIN